jgi:hypothetical protein
MHDAKNACQKVRRRAKTMTLKRRQLNLDQIAQLSVRLIRNSHLHF